MPKISSSTKINSGVIKHNNCQINQTDNIFQYIARCETKLVETKVSMK